MKRAWLLVPLLVCFLIGTQSSTLLTRLPGALQITRPEVNRVEAVIEAGRLPSADYFNAVEFSEARHVWAVGREGAVLRLEAVR